MLRWVAGEFDAPEIESWEQMKARVAGSLRLLMESHGRGKTIAVFTSGGPIAASIAHVLGLPGERAMRLNWQLVNSSISRFMYNEERITLAGFNPLPTSRCHDPSPSPIGRRMPVQNLEHWSSGVLRMDLKDRKIAADSSSPSLLHYSTTPSVSTLLSKNPCRERNCFGSRIAKLFKQRRVPWISKSQKR
jgi:hypothetical protein